jgi:hypothetical protein
MGVDVDHDGRVDRWNRDGVAAHQPAPAEASTANSTDTDSGDEDAAEPDSGNSDN